MNCSWMAGPLRQSLTEGIGGRCTAQGWHSQHHGNEPGNKGSGCGSDVIGTALVAGTYPLSQFLFEEGHHNGEGDADVPRLVNEMETFESTRECFLLRGEVTAFTYPISLHNQPHEGN